jgi:hypothetical protein
LQVVAALLLAYALVLLSSSPERPGSPALTYLLAAACLGLALPPLLALARLAAGPRRGVLRWDAWLAGLGPCALLFTAACAAWGVLGEERALGLGCAAGQGQQQGGRCSSLRAVGGVRGVARTQHQHLPGGGGL